MHDTAKNSTPLLTINTPLLHRGKQKAYTMYSKQLGDDIIGLYCMPIYQLMKIQVSVKYKKNLYRLYVFCIGYTRSYCKKTHFIA